MNQKGFSSVLFFVIITVILVLGYFAYNRTNKQSLSLRDKTPDQAACTQEAKVCPDGSSVSRVAPKCDFAPCPLSSGMNQKTYINRTYKYELEYPENITLQNGVPSDDLANTNSLEIGFHSGQPSIKVATIHVTNPEISDFKNPQHSVTYSTLEQYVSKIWQLNHDNPNSYVKNKQASDIHETEIDNHPAFQFMIDGAYINGWGEMTLDEQQTLTFIMSNNKIYALMYPTANETLKQVISTFKFIQ